MTRRLLIPGLDGSPEPHWQHWWAATDPKALTVEQDNWATPTIEAWETQIAGAVITYPDSILIAHSLGCLVVARLLRRWPQLRVKGALLVAPADPSVSTRLRGFAQVAAGPLGVPVTVGASRNDPWMRFARARDMARDWGAELVDLGFAGHVNVASGYGPWTEGKQICADLEDRAALWQGAPRAGAEPLAQRWAF